MEIKTFLITVTVILFIIDTDGHKIRGRRSPELSPDLLKDQRAIAGRDLTEATVGDDTQSRPILHFVIVFPPPLPPATRTVSVACSDQFISNPINKSGSFDIDDCRRNIQTSLRKSGFLLL